ncbi:hypothetical protein V0M98_33945 (plasmid) [Pseudomonas silesiensis]|uniref:hypothetical protein n=1 Tax=Pseudomonas silesiensis TaxID=1853130 RepID=UPI0030D4B167
MEKTSSLIAYHGTNFEFEKFDHKLLGVSCENPTTQMGFFFTDVVVGAWRWASTGSECGRAPDSPSIVVADLGGLKLKVITPKKFWHYLRKARGETIWRHLCKWKSSGYDGLRIKLEDEEWFCVFEASKINIVGRERTPLTKPQTVPMKDLPPPRMLFIPPMPKAVQAQG